VSLTYNTFTTSLANLIVVPVSDPNYAIALPNIIDDAEQRLYRELDLLSTRVRATAALTAGSRNFTLPTPSGASTFIVVEQFNAITPAGTTDPELGTRRPMNPTSKEYLDAIWPSAAGAGVPNLFAPISQNDWIVGCWPDAAYTVEVVGTIRPAPLSASNQQTFLSTQLPDLFLAAALVMAAGYQLNFSAAGDNPQAGVTWESHVKTLLDSAKVEEIRKRFGSQGWTSMSPDPIATPPRT
jgi:hypothetical protein